MPGKRIPDLPAIAGASTANDDNLVIYDTDASTTKRILRSQLAAGLVGDLPYTPAGFITATTVPTAIAEIASDLAAGGGAALIGNTPAGGIAASTVQAALNELDTEKVAFTRLDDNDGSNLVGFLQAGVDAVPRTAQSKMRDVVSVFDFMTTAEIADVTARTSSLNVTAAVQAALDAAPDRSAVYFPAGLYSIGNITIPNKKLTLIGDGRFQSSLTARSGAISNSDYLIASSAYVNNSTFGSEPILVKDIGFSGAGLTDNVFVLYGYYSRLTDCSFFGPANTGAALLMTSDGISGSACSTTLVENRIDHCNIQGSDASTYAFRIRSSGQKTTDAFISDNIIRNGSVALTSMAGTVFDKNHLYANAAVNINRLSLGSRVSNNYFEDAIEINDCLDFNVQVNDNIFIGRVTLSFGNSGTIITLNDNTFQGSADLFHNYFSSAKHAVVNGGSFATSTPVVFHSGTSTGRVTFNRVFNKGLGYEQDGSRTANTGRISLVSWGTAAPTTGTWSVGDKVINTTPTAGGNIGWVCTTGGTPGTWKTYGTIAA